jgi:uncharacterized protein (DUF2126 family)
VVDTWHKRSIGGCKYHVTHPGGRSYDDFPVNANVAEARRVSRFWGFDHTPGGPMLIHYSSRGQWSFGPEGSRPGPTELPSAEINAEYPHTLDLRRGPASG